MILVISLWKMSPEIQKKTLVRYEIYQGGRSECVNGKNLISNPIK